MRTNLAIRVENLSKAYRIGLKEQQQETMLGAVAAWVKSPFTNFREVRNLSRFGDANLAGSSSRMADSRSAHCPLPTQIASPPNDLFWALREVSFELKHGEAIGIIGRNGAGKSTLLKILCRITEPTSGRALIYGRVASLLEVGTGFHPDLTGRENVYLNGTILGMKKREVDAKFDEIVAFSGVENFIDTPVKRYSSGMRVRLAFSVAAHLEPEILIIDEVLAVGDAEFQKQCLGKMENAASQGRTVLFVSHNLEAVLTLCDSAMILNEGYLSFMGKSSEAVHRYQRSGLEKRGDQPAHVVWENSAVEVLAQPVIQRVEILSLDGIPKPVIQTWDDIRFRIHYLASTDIISGSVVLEIRDHRDARLCVMNSGLHLPLRSGQQQVDCVIARFPLAAGEYIVGVGLALSNAQWLWRNTNVGTIVVNGRDVFDTGRPPVNSRMVFAVPHEWSA